MICSKRLGDQERQFRDDHGPFDFSKVEDEIKEILAIEEGKTGRSTAWCQAVKEGKLYKGENIPIYDQGKWDKERDGFPGLEDVSEVKAFSVYKFYQAAGLHQYYVLRELLPEYGLVVI